MLCDHCKKNEGYEVEVYDTAGLDTQNRELCLTCMSKAEDTGHAISFLDDATELAYANYLAAKIGY